MDSHIHKPFVHRTEHLILTDFSMGTNYTLSAPISWRDHSNITFKMPRLKEITSTTLKGQHAYTLVNSHPQISGLCSFSQYKDYHWWVWAGRTGQGEDVQEDLLPCAGSKGASVWRYWLQALLPTTGALNHHWYFMWDTQKGKYIESENRLVIS